MDIVFVILHYNVIQETQNLIASIKDKIDTDKYQIIVVDNHSPNGSGETLATSFQDDEEVTVIINKENIGFAKGNNIGIDYARNTFDPDYICCLNNDTLLIQSDFLYQIKKEYKKSNAAVIGPLAYLKDGSVQTSAYVLRDLDYYKHELDRYLVDGENAPNPGKSWMKERLPFVYKTLKSVKNNYIFPGLCLRKENRVLHGSCLIFTPSFFDVLKGFDNRTFLFREEELLYISTKKQNLLTVYNPKIRIKHLEDAATDSIIQTSDEKKEFIRKHQIASLKILIDEMEKVTK